MHTNNKMATEDDVYDVVLASSRLLANVRRLNRQTRPRRFWVHDVLRRRDDFHRYLLMSAEQFDYVLGLVGPHISRLPTVYVAV